MYIDYPDIRIPIGARGVHLLQCLFSRQQHMFEQECMFNKFRFPKKPTSMFKMHTLTNSHPHSRSLSEMNISIESSTTTTTTYTQIRCWINGTRAIPPLTRDVHIRKRSWGSCSSGWQRASPGFTWLSPRTARTAVARASSSCAKLVRHKNLIHHPKWCIAAF